jgi:hypothetical protein
MTTHSLTQPGSGNLCQVCRKKPVAIPQGTCERCKQELRVENRLEYFEALSWEVEYEEGRRGRG